MRRILLAAVAVAALAGCANTQPNTVAQDITLIDTGLQGALKQVPNVPPAAQLALNDLNTVVAAFQKSDVSSAATAQRIMADVNAVVLAVTPLAAAIPPPAGPAIAVALQAADVLLPVVEEALTGTAPVGAVPGTMSAAQARVVLAGAAHR